MILYDENQPIVMYCHLFYLLCSLSQPSLLSPLLFPWSLHLYHEGPAFPSATSISCTSKILVLPSINFTCITPFCRPASKICQLYLGLPVDVAIYTTGPGFHIKCVYQIPTEEQHVDKEKHQQHGNTLQQCCIAHSNSIISRDDSSAINNLVWR